MNDKEDILRDISAKQKYRFVHQLMSEMQNIVLFCVS